MQTDVAIAVAESMPTPSVKESTPLHSCEPTAPPQWISHLEGRTLVEGTAEAFRHPRPGKSDPLATLLNLSDVGLEDLCGGFMRRIYPEDGYSPAERERMRDAFHRRFVDGRHDAYAQFRSEVAELQAVSADEALQMYADVTRAPLPKAWRTLRARRTVGPVDPADPIALSLGDLAPLVADPRGVAPPARREGRLAVAPCSEESSRVLSAHYIVAFLRGCAVLASRRELQDKGVLEPDCPVCLDMLAAGNSVVTFHVLECGHRCEAAAAMRLLTTTQPPHGRMCSVPGHHPHARSPAACVAGSTKSACSRSRRRGPRLARCACARSAESRRAPRTPLRFEAKWRDVATAAIAGAQSWVPFFETHQVQ